MGAILCLYGKSKLYKIINLDNIYLLPLLIYLKYIRIFHIKNCVITIILFKIYFVVSTIIGINFHIKTHTADCEKKLMSCFLYKLYQRKYFVVVYVLLPKEYYFLNIVREIS